MYVSIADLGSRSITNPGSYHTSCEYRQGEGRFRQRGCGATPSPAPWLWVHNTGRGSPQASWTVYPPGWRLRISMTATPEIDPAIVSTHDALFDTWFPLAELPIPPPILPDITAIAATVRAGMLASFSTSSVFPLLQNMTYPAGLPFFD